jgi:hypothetical protein
MKTELKTVELGSYGWYGSQEERDQRQKGIKEILYFLISKFSSEFVEKLYIDKDGIKISSSPKIF